MLCAKVVCIEEPGFFLFNISEEPLPLEVLNERHLAPGRREACENACGLEGMSLAVDAGVLVGEKYTWV